MDYYMINITLQQFYFILKNSTDISFKLIKNFMLFISLFICLFFIITVILFTQGYVSNHISSFIFDFSIPYLSS